MKKKRKPTFFLSESSLDLALFDFWQKEHVIFIPTTACEEVESLIEKQNLVIVVGQSGSGKSAIIQHIALKYRSQGWAVKPITEVNKIFKAYESNNILSNKTLFVINDPIGKESFDEMAFASWKKYDLDLRACLENIKMLISCRKCVQCDVRAKGFFEDNSNIIDIDSGKCILSNNEKRHIFNKYNTNGYVFSETDLEEVLKTKKYFPLLCKLFFSDTEMQKDGVFFFTEPVKRIEAEIRALKYKHQEKYCALVLIVLFNNALRVGDLWNNENSKKLYKHALKLCGMSTTTAPFRIRDALETLKDGFVSKIGNAYQFCHDLVMEITSYVFGLDFPTDMIRYADIVFLRKRVKLKDHNVQTDQLTVSISDTHLDSLAERLLKEIVGEKIFDVVLNPLLKDKKVADALINNIKKDKTKIETLFVKISVEKKLLLENQNFNEKSKGFLFSKLDFLSLNCTVSPACALIVFSHADLSIYCLQVLQQLPRYFKDSSVFFAVCCNSKTDLFNMFSKDEIKTCLKEKWGYLYPIHIVSVFHNNEILQKLIELGVDVNQSDEDGDTALMYAVRNITGVSEDKYTDARHYKTLKLLLHNGADINVCDKLGRSPLYIACKNGHARPFQFLLRRETNVNFCIAVSESLIEIFDHRLKLSQRDLCNEFGLSFLHRACFYGDVNSAECLLNHGADINSCDTFGNSPLYVACQNRNGCVVQLLLRYKADINLCNKFGFSPLYIACFNRDSSTVKLLLDHKADVNLCDTFGNSPFNVAFSNKSDSIVQLLISHGAGIN